MQIVIDIDDNLYTRLFNNGDIDAVDMLKACAAIRKGISLPKGHGALKDVDLIPYLFDLTRTDPIYSGKDIQCTIKLMRTIIPADKSESEEGNENNNACLRYM